MRVRTQERPCPKHAQCIRRIIKFSGVTAWGHPLEWKENTFPFDLGRIRESSLRVGVWLESTGHPRRVSSQYSAVSAGMAKKALSKNLIMPWAVSQPPHIAFRWKQKPQDIYVIRIGIWNLPREHARKPYTPERGVHPVQESKQRYHTWGL